jgi:hypothetical protein
MTDEIRIDLIDDDLEPGELEQDALALREELLGLDDVERVGAAPGGPAPDGSRAGAVTELTSLIVAVPPVVDAVAKVLGAVRAWLRRRSDAGERPTTALKITVNGQTLELTPTAAEQAELVEQFLRTAAAPGQAPA